MAQITHGVRAVLSSPPVYSAFQRFMGAHADRLRFVNEYLRPRPGMAILDIGCGPADIMAYLPEVRYHGFDISDSYIQRARERFGDRGTFHLGHLRPDDLAGLPKFDRVIGIGLLHHLDDDTALEVLRLARGALAPGGTMVTLDPCLDPAQNPLARFLVKSDRGQNVRDRRGYAELANQVFSSVEATVRHKVWIPYTHCFMVSGQA